MMRRLRIKMNSILNTADFSAIVLLLLIVISGTTFVSATSGTEYGPGEAIEYGLQESSELEQQRLEVRNLERELADMQASLGLNIDFSGEYTDPYDSAEDSFGQPLDNSLTLGLDSSFVFQGFRIGSSLTSTDYDPYDWEDLEDDYELDFSFSRQVFPFLPVEEERQVRSLEVEAEKARADYENARDTQLIEWLSDYAGLVEQKARLEILTDREELTREALNRVEHRQEIGEAGEIELREAEVSLREARLERKRLEDKLERQQSAWKSNLGLTEDTEVRISGDIDYLDSWEEEVTDRNLPDEKEQLWQTVIEEHSDIRAVERELELAEQELSWSRRGRAPELEISGEYAHQDEEWQTVLSLSYPLYDGGQRKRKVEEKQENVDYQEKARRRTREQLENRLDELLSGVEAAEEECEIKELQLERSRLEADKAEKHLDEGVISETEYRQKVLQAQEARIALEAAEREIVFAGMRVFVFVEGL
ncbi:MAG: TolC family protein [Halanaerobiales bacterium]